MRQSFKSCRSYFALGTMCLAVAGCDRVEPAMVKEAKKQPLVQPQAAVVQVKTNNFEDLVSLAEAGNAEAQASLGVKYAKGETVAQDRIEALKWFRKAADQNNAQAQYSLGVIYAKGEVVKSDFGGAVKWFRSAAEHGYAPAQCALGQCYLGGHGVTNDSKLAVSWFLKAGQQGNAKAQYHLGVAYLKGEGAEEDYAGAVKWFRKAAEQGHLQAQLNLAACCVKGKGTPLNYADAIKWFRSAAEQGDLTARFALSRMYFEGKAVPRDYAESYKWVNLIVAQAKPVDWLKCGGIAVKPSPVPLVIINHVTIECGETARVKTPIGDLRVKCLSTDSNGAQIMLEGESKPRTLLLDTKKSLVEKFEAVLKLRSALESFMTKERVEEGQRRASAFVVKDAGNESEWEDFLPEPKTDEAKAAPAYAVDLPDDDGTESRFNPGKEVTGSGTGFFVTDDGYLITCEHVVRGASSYRVQTAKGSLSANLVREDSSKDLALLKVTGTFRALPIALDTRVKLGDAVFTIGFPNHLIQGVEPKLTTGEISSLAGIRDDPHQFQISVPVQPGNSGGPLVDVRGNVVGVVAAKLNELAAFQSSGSMPQNVNYAVKSDLISEFLKDVPELRGKLKAASTQADRDASVSLAEHAAVLVLVGSPLTSTVPVPVR